MLVFTTGRMVVGLVREFLEHFNLEFTTAVFEPETNSVSLDSSSFNVWFYRFYNMYKILVVIINHVDSENGGQINTVPRKEKVV